MQVVNTRRSAKLNSHSWGTVAVTVVCMSSKGGYFEEAQICRERELQLKARLTGPVGVTSAMLPVVSAADVEAVVSVWSGVPVEQMSNDEMKRLRQLQSSLKVCIDALCCMHVTSRVEPLELQ